MTLNWVILMIISSYAIYEYYLTLWLIMVNNTEILIFFSYRYRNVGVYFPSSNWVLFRIALSSSVAKMYSMDKLCFSLHQESYFPSIMFVLVEWELFNKYSLYILNKERSKRGSGHFVWKIGNTTNFSVVLPSLAGEGGGRGREGKQSKVGDTVIHCILWCYRH